MLKLKTTKNAIKQFKKISQLTLLLLTLTVAANSQQSHSEDEDYIKPGVLQIEYGYDSNFRGSEFRFQQSAPLNVRFAAGSRLLLEAEVETVLFPTRRTGR